MTLREKPLDPHAIISAPDPHRRVQGKPSGKHISKSQSSSVQGGSRDRIATATYPCCSAQGGSKGEQSMVSSHTQSSTGTALLQEGTVDDNRAIVETAAEAARTLYTDIQRLHSQQEVRREAKPEIIGPGKIKKDDKMIAYGHHISTMIVANAQIQFNRTNWLWKEQRDSHYC